MKKLGIALLVAAGVLVLAVVAMVTFYYVKIYPMTSPLITVAGGARLEERLLEHQGAFVPPLSGELTEAQVAKFAAVEEVVQVRVALDLALLGEGASSLQRASRDGELSLKDAIPGLGAVKKVYLGAKMAQIEALNEAGLSKAEFEWIRQELYRAAALRLSQLDVSGMLAGVEGLGAAATCQVRQFEPGGRVPDANAALAGPLTPRLREWLPLGFFGL